MHEENFLGSWLEEDGNNKEEMIGEVGKETEEETGQKKIREEWREENETVIVKGRCINSVSTEAFEIFVSRRVVVIPGVTCRMVLVAVSDCDSGIGTSVHVVLVMTDVLVCPFFCGDGGW